jgi:hypothetical protein
LATALVVGSGCVQYYYYKNYLDEKPDKFSDAWFRSKQDTKDDIWAVQVWDSIMPKVLKLGIHNRENPSERGEKFDQYRQYNWARSSTSGQMRGMKTAHHEAVILRQKDELLTTVDSINENSTDVKVIQEINKNYYGTFFKFSINILQISDWLNAG